VNWGDGSSSNATLTPDGNGGYNVAAAHTFTEGGNNGVSIAISDAGGATLTITDPATVADPPLSAQGMTVSLVEGSTSSNVIAKFTDADPNTTPSEYNVTVDWGDGTTTGGSVAADPNGGYDVLGSHNYDEGQYQVKVTIQDAGGSTATAQSTAAVSDASISVAGSTSLAASEGQVFSGVVATLTDSNTSASTADFTVTIDWGDQTTSTGTVSSAGGGQFNVSGSHSYAEEGNYNLKITVNDDGGSSNQGTTTASVADSALKGKGSLLTFNEGTPFTGVVASFTDLNALATAQDFTATIKWGDNTTSTGSVVADPAGGFDVIGTHNTFEEGNPIVSVTINDKGGATTNSVTLTDITDAPLTGTGQVAVTTEFVAPGNAAVAPPALTLATFKDANPNAQASEFNVSINWGDGTTSGGTLVPKGNATFTVIGNHAYRESGPFPVMVTVSEVDGHGSVAIQAAAYAQDAVIPVTGTLAPGSDSGPSHTDGITNVTTPIFQGSAEINSTVTLYAQRVGQTTVTAVARTTANALGAWAVATSALADGSYAIYATSTDNAGHVTGPFVLLPSSTEGFLTIDTVGPKVLSSVLNPVTGTVTVTYQDDRAGMNLASLMNVGNYTANTNAVAPKLLPVTSALVTSAGGPTAPVTVAVKINGGRRLSNGQYVLTVNALGITDMAGNTLVETHFIAFPQLGNSPPGNYVAEYVVVGNALAPAQQLIPAVFSGGSSLGAKVKTRP
jgi:hypothetical protein